MKTVVLENKFFRIECLAEAGPRIIRLIPQWTGENLFAELPKHVLQTPRGEYHFYGGHRLWRAPESLARSAIPDDSGVTASEVEGGFKLIGTPDPVTGIRKSIIVQMSSSQPFIIVKHMLKNVGSSTVRLAPWAITMLRTKGTAILPQELGNVDDDGVQPNRRFALWPYTRWDDPRLRLGKEFITIRTDASKSPMKFGYFNPHGWLGYVYDDTVFIKRFGVRRDEDYPDYGCNSEVFVNDRVLELESLGPLVNLAPESNIVYTETWEVHNLNDMPKELHSEKIFQELIQK